VLPTGTDLTAEGISRDIIVNRALAEAVVGCLSLSGETCEVNVLSKFRMHDWYRTFNWLDRAGPTLYLLQRLKNISATELLPSCGVGPV
jgi:hypothetical protein